QWVAVNDDLLTHIMALTSDSPLGCIVECDISIPQHLHSKFRDFPLAPEHSVTTFDQLSDYQKLLLIQLERKHIPTKKLLLTCTNKKNYIIHYRLLQLYVSLGAVITKI